MYAQIELNVIESNISSNAQDTTDFSPMYCQTEYIGDW